MDSQSIRLWLRARQLPLVLTALATLTAIGALWGLQVVPIPQPTGLGGAVTLLWYHPMLAACAIATTLHSPMPDQETIGSVRLDLWNRLLITGLALVDSLLLAAVATAGDNPHSNYQLIGGLLYWLALALVSARILGPGRFWALPLLAYIPITWWGFDNPVTSQSAPWWAVPTQDNGWSTLLAGAAWFAAGIAVSLVSRHRLRRLRWRR